MSLQSALIERFGQDKISYYSAYHNNSYSKCHEADIVEYTYRYLNNLMPSYMMDSFVSKKELLVYYISEYLPILLQYSNEELELFLGNIDKSMLKMFNRLEILDHVFLDTKNYVQFIMDRRKLSE